MASEEEWSREGSDPEPHLISAQSPAAKTTGLVVLIESSTTAPPWSPFVQSTEGRQGRLRGRITAPSQG
jgi:hypothetical protein